MDKNKRTEHDMIEQKVIQSCQSGCRKAYRKYGKKLLALKKELGMSVPAWMEAAWGRRL